MLLCRAGGDPPRPREYQPGFWYANPYLDVDTGGICYTDFYSNPYPLPFCDSHTRPITHIDNYGHNHFHPHHHSNANDHYLAYPFQYTFHSAHLHQNTELYGYVYTLSIPYSNKHACPYLNIHPPTILNSHTSAHPWSISIRAALKNNIDSPGTYEL
jgi:hypothetical protein